MTDYVFVFISFVFFLGGCVQCDQIWRNFTALAKIITSLWQFFDSLFLMWQNAVSTLANLLHYWANFPYYKWPKNGKSHWLRRQMWACLPVRVSAKVVRRTTL